MKAVIYQIIRKDMMSRDYIMNVNEEDKKLESVVKSCKAARICSRIIFILMVVATVITLVTGIVLMVNPDKTIVFDMDE